MYLYQVPVPGTRCLVPGTWYHVPGVPGTWYLVPGTWCIYTIPNLLSVRVFPGDIWISAGKTDQMTARQNEVSAPNAHPMTWPWPCHGHGHGHGHVHVHGHGHGHVAMAMAMATAVAMALPMRSRAQAPLGSVGSPSDMRKGDPLLLFPALLLFITLKRPVGTGPIGNIG